MRASIPLDLRIDLAEAFIELAWADLCELPKSRGGIIEDARYVARRRERMAGIDDMLDQLLPMYDQRALTLATEAS